MQDTASPPVRLHNVPWSAGWLWFAQGLKAFATQPFALGGLFLMAVAALQVVMLVPLLGPLVWVILSPALSVGFMAAMGEAQAGGRPRAMRLLAAFRTGPTKRVRILQLGGLYLSAVLLLAVSTSFIFSDETARFAQSQMAQLDTATPSVKNGNGSTETLAPTTTEGAAPPKAGVPANTPPVPLSGGVLVFILVLVFMATLLTWHAPALVFWHNVPPIKAMFFSAVACLRNFGAMVTYLGVWALVIAPITYINYAIQSAGNSSSWIVAIFFPLSLMTAAIFTLSNYFTFRGCFQDTAPIP